MPSSPLPLLLDFDHQYHRDQRQSADFLHRRDRRLALDYQRRHGSLPGQAAWLGEIGAASGPEQSKHPDSAAGLRGWRRLRLLFMALGAVLGVLTMLGLLYYDGGRRINVTLIVAMALLQLLLALLTSAQAMVGARPWRGLFRDGAPRWWPLPEPAPMLRVLQPHLAARIAHGGGLAFGLCALLTLLTQVLIKDLAFGWSTTLQASAAGYHELMRALAWPWREWLPSAVPSLELVERSRYFRLDQGAPAEPALLGGWWPFLAMLWAVYAVIPRLLLLAFGSWQLRRRALALLRDHPGHTALLERFNTAYVESDRPADHEPLPASRSPRIDGGPALPVPGTLIRWAGAGAGQPGLARHLIQGDEPLVLNAGGAASLEQDAETLAEAAQCNRPLVIVTRGWEPPTGELQDFLTDARQRCAAGTPLILVPLAAGGDPAPARDDTLAQWRRFALRQKDPRLSVAGFSVAEAD